MPHSPQSTTGQLTHEEAKAIAQWFGLTAEELMSPQSILILPKWSNDTSQ
jgi:hypothetical protein